MSNFDRSLLDKIADQCKTKEDIFGEQGIVQQLIKKTLESALRGEMNDHLAHLCRL